MHKFHYAFTIHFISHESKVRMQSCICNGDFPSYPARQLHITAGDGDAFSMEATQVWILHEIHHVCLCGLLQRWNGHALHSESWVDSVTNLSTDTPKSNFRDDHVRASLVFPNFCERLRPWAESIRLPWFLPHRHVASLASIMQRIWRRSSLRGDEGGTFFCGFPGCLLCACHKLWVWATLGLSLLHKNCAYIYSHMYEEYSPMKDH